MTQPSNVLMQPRPDAVWRLTLIEKLERERNGKARLADYYKTVALEHLVHGLDTAIGIVKQHSDWIDISVEPDNRTEFDSEVVLAIDVNGYTYNVTLVNVSIGNKTKREWTECKAKWNGEFWEAIEYVCQSEKLVAYRYIPKPPSEVAA